MKIKIVKEYNYDITDHLIKNAVSDFLDDYMYNDFEEMRKNYINFISAILTEEEYGPYAPEGEYSRTCQLLKENLSPEQKEGLWALFTNNILECYVKELEAVKEENE